MDTKIVNVITSSASLLIAMLLILAANPAKASPPNVVFVMTDDQGYGDLGYTGNPIVQTPNIDRLAAESSQLTDYHVAPTCSPTRAALLTGHWTNRTGVWHTINGRSMLRDNEITLGQLLKDHGYATGMFGKWHLGDNYPYRPEDRGFTEVYRHGGGGVGQTPDLWDNAYFDGHYYHNGKIAPAEGFCTDVFFRQANRFIRDQAAAGQPFFAYISLNAPHGPLHAPQRYLDQYHNQDRDLAAFYGMITNIDDNVGATRELLKELKIADNTIFIFTTDNGTATGAKVFNAGMRGTKGSEYDGGHRVPFIAHWPRGGWNRKHLSDTICHAVDMVPTLLEITGANKPAGITFDGISIRRLLDPNDDQQGWPERFLVTDSQRVRDPVKWKQSAVMSQHWRLVNGTELYEIKKDPGQSRDCAAEYPQQLEKMRAFYEQWWNELEPTFAMTTEIPIGHSDHPVVSLTGHDWIQEALPPWNQQHIREGFGFRRPTTSVGQRNQPRGRSDVVSRHTGHWAIKVLSAGDYRISIRRWPVESGEPITAALAAGADVPGASKAFRARPGLAISATKATLRIDGKDWEHKPVSPGAIEASFDVTLTAGSMELAPYFSAHTGDEVGAYYAVISKQ